MRFKHTPKRKLRILALIDFHPKENQHQSHSMYTSHPLLRQSFVPWKGWEAQWCPSHHAQCSSVQSGDAARGVSSTSLYKSRLQVSPESPLCLSIYSAAPNNRARQEGLKKSPRRRRAPTTSTSSDPKTLQCVAQRIFKRLMIRGLGKPSHPSAKSSSSKCAFSTVPEMRHPDVSVDQLQNFTEGGKRDVKSPLWCESPWGVITLLQHHGPWPNTH